MVTVSTSSAAGESTDESGPKLAGLVSGLAGGDVAVSHLTVGDDRQRIAELLSAEIAAGTDLVLTTGGTGMSRDDVTPEATLDVIEREAPGLAEAIRADSATRIATGILSRGVAGIAGRTLIVNLPGSPRAVGESFAVLEPVLPHALAQIGDDGGRDRH